MEGVRPRLGVLGGSFDPPHLGHLIIASVACATFNLERVLFVPAAAPPHKLPEERTSAPIRLEMTELAVQDDIRFVASGLEVERGLVFTCDTLQAAAQRFAKHDLVFILGSDSLLQFETWHEPERVLELAQLAVAPRMGDDPEAIAAAAARWAPERVTILDSPLIAISSSDVRARVAAGRPVRYLVPPAVEELILERGLYTAAQAAR
jgi:nicotinate-nucleotide adenylyltransferase